MPYSTPAIDDIRAALLRDLRNLLPDADVTVDSDNYVRATVLASAIEGLYQHQIWMVKQLFPDTAEADLLDRHANLHGITRKPAAAATGTITYSGTVGAAIGVGVEAKTTDGIAFVTLASGVIGGGGTVDLAAQASTPAAAGNVAAATALTLTSPPTGIASTATVVSMSGGADTESDAALLARLLDMLRNPPAGGNAYDYRRWTLSIAGVDSAYVYPQRRGIGTVDVAVVAEGNALPSPTLLASVQTYLDSVRPVACKDVAAVSPAILSVPVTAQVKLTGGVNLTDATAAIQTELTDYFNGLVPGDAVFKSQIEAIISGVAGVTDRAVSAPAANVSPTVDANTIEWCQLGTLTVTLLP